MSSDTKLEFDVPGLHFEGSIIPEGLGALERVASLSFCHALADWCDLYALFLTAASPPHLRTLAVPRIGAEEKALRLHSRLAGGGDKPGNADVTYLSMEILMEGYYWNWLHDAVFLRDLLHDPEESQLRQENKPIPHKLSEVKSKLIDLWIVSGIEKIRINSSRGRMARYEPFAQAFEA